MPRHLRQEIQPSRPFDSIEQEAYLQIVLTAQVTGRLIAEALKPSGLTPAQFNVLRILRGASPEALPSCRISERMVNHDPDLTRLIDRLEASGLVEKSRHETDRRVMNVRITAAGLERVQSASVFAQKAMAAALEPVGRSKLETLADLLELVRDSAMASRNDETKMTKPSTEGEFHGKRKGRHSDHGSDRQAGRRRRPRAAGQAQPSARDDAPRRRRPGA